MNHGSMIDCGIRVMENEQTTAFLARGPTVCWVAWGFIDWRVQWSLITSQLFLLGPSRCLSYEKELSC